MWCANCNADVAAEVAVDNQRIRCATCGNEISAAPASLPNSSTRDARELLERWSDNDLLDSLMPLPGVSEPAETATPEPVASSQPTVAAVRESKPKFRIDAPHNTADSTPPAESELQLGSPQAAPAEAHHVHQAHEFPTAAPHFDMQDSAGDRTVRKANSASQIGQVLAYAGVGVLTIGTTLVLWGYFSGPASYAPTGWLITTAGQMLLFLGVVTLVSGGMEQTNDEVARRIERIGERILRIEQASRDHALRGPSIPAERFADGVPSGNERRVVEQQAGDRR